MREQVRRLSQVVSTCFAVQQTNAKAERRTASALTAVEREVALLRRAHLGNGGGGRPLIASSGAPAFASSAKRGQSGSAGGNSQAKRSRRAGGSGSGGGRSARAVSVAVPLAPPPSPSHPGFPPATLHPRSVDRGAEENGRNVPQRYRYYRHRCDDKTWGLLHLVLRERQEQELRVRLRDHHGL